MYFSFCTSVCVVNFFLPFCWEDGRLLCGLTGGVEWVAKCTTSFMDWIQFRYDHSPRIGIALLSLHAHLLYFRVLIFFYCAFRVAENGSVAVERGASHKEGWHVCAFIHGLDPISLRPYISDLKCTSFIS